MAFLWSRDLFDYSSEADLRLEAGTVVDPRIDFRNAVVSGYVRGRRVRLNGSHLVFWVQSWVPAAGKYVNYAYTASSLDHLVEERGWQPFQLQLNADDAEWDCLGARGTRRYLYGCASLHEVLSSVNRDFGWLLFPVEARPGGKILPPLVADWPEKYRRRLPSGSIDFDEVEIRFHTEDVAAGG